MVIAATGLIILGGIIALMGLKLFKVLLPIIGLISGIMVGFSGVQAVFGKGAVSLSIALVTAVIVGTIMMFLSYMFFHMAVVVLFTMLGAAVTSYLGIALGLGDAGFVMFLLGLAGAIMGFIVSTSTPMSSSLVVVLTSFLGVSYVLAGVMLITGELTTEGLHETGIINSVLDVVDQAFLWLLVWLGGSLFAVHLQNSTRGKALFNDAYTYDNLVVEK